MTIYGYALGDDPPSERQVAALQAAGCEEVIFEATDSLRAARPRLSELLQEIGSGDSLIVTRLDRLAGSTRDLLTVVDALAARGASIRSLGEAWADTAGPGGEVIRTVLTGLAGFERDLIRTRTGARQARAKARGLHVGRPPKLTTEQWRAAEVDLARSIATQADLARRLNVSEATISRRVARFAPAPLPVQRSLDAATQRATQAFLQRIEGRYPVQEAILFGSRARGTHTADSDADVAVILAGEKGNRSAIGRELSDAAYEVMLETGVLIGALPLWQEEFEQPERFTNPELIRNIRREGLRL